MAYFKIKVMSLKVELGRAIPSDIIEHFYMQVNLNNLKSITGKCSKLCKTNKCSVLTFFNVIGLL